jgi:regulatory protein SWI6
MQYTRLFRSDASASGARKRAYHIMSQVYECMVRGIAVMRRRADAYVNATQILKVAGIDKGRRTKILEKEILPGKHEIVQGGYGKYQGTWCVL